MRYVTIRSMYAFPGTRRRFREPAVSTARVLRSVAADTH